MPRLANGARYQVIPLICEGVMIEDGAFVTNVTLDKGENHHLSLIDPLVDQMGD
jgi:hypothetical protein